MLSRDGKGHLFALGRGVEAYTRHFFTIDLKSSRVGIDRAELLEKFSKFPLRSYTEAMAPAQEVSSRIFTLANVISVVRLMSIPVFLVLVINDELLTAFILLVAAVLTDFVDGMIARAMNQITRLGQFLDPFADRLFIAATVIALAIQDVVPWWFVVAVMLRDALLGVGGLVMSRYGAATLPVKWWGKVATFGMLFVLPLFFLGAVFESVGALTHAVAWALAVAVVVLYWMVGFSYLFDAIAVARNAKHDEPKSSGSIIRSSKESDERNTQRV